jgi:hypothetical protein
MLIGLLIFLVPLSTAYGIAAFFGADTVRGFDGRPVHGLAAVALSPLLGACMALGFALILGTACNIGLWLYSIRGRLVLQVIDSHDEG